MDNYKGIYANHKTNKPRFFEGGAHFKYKDLYRILELIYEKREEKKKRESEKIKEELLINENKDNLINENKDNLIDENHKSYINNERSNSLNYKNLKRNNQNILLSLTEKNYDNNNKKEEEKIPIKKSKMFINLNHEKLNLKLPSEVNLYNLNKEKPFINNNNNYSLGKITIQNKTDSSNYILNKHSKSTNKNYSHLNSNNLPIINIKNLIKDNNPIQIISVNNKNKEIKSRNTQLDNLNSNSYNINLQNKGNYLFESNNTYAIKYNNPLNKINHLKLLSSDLDKKDNNVILTSRNRDINLINHKSISFTKNYLSELNSNNNVLNYNHNRNTLNKNDNNTFSITSKIIIGDMKNSFKSPINKKAIKKLKIINNL